MEVEKVGEQQNNVLKNSPSAVNHIRKEGAKSGSFLQSGLTWTGTDVM